MISCMFDECDLRLQIQPTTRVWQLLPYSISPPTSFLYPHPLFTHLNICFSAFLFTLWLVELAMIMDRLYGGVCYAGIDTDPELKYPKGAGRVAFSNQQSYIAAISARFVQLQHGDIDKRVRPPLHWQFPNSLFFMKWIWLIHHYVIRAICECKSVCVCVCQQHHHKKAAACCYGEQNLIRADWISFLPSLCCYKPRPFINIHIILLYVFMHFPCLL